MSDYELKTPFGRTIPVELGFAAKAIATPINLLEPM